MRYVETVGPAVIVKILFVAIVTWVEFSVRWFKKPVGNRITNSETEPKEHCPGCPKPNENCGGKRHICTTSSPTGLVERHSIDRRRIGERNYFKDARLAKFG